MNKEALESIKTQCQAAADAFARLQDAHHHIPHEQLEFNYAVLLALKGVYESISSLE